MSVPSGFEVNKTHEKQFFVHCMFFRGIFSLSFNASPSAVYPFASAFLQKKKKKKIYKLTHFFFIHKTSSHKRLSYECAIDPKALAAELSFSFGFRCQTGKKTQCQSIQTWNVEQVLMTALFFGLIDCSLLWFSYFHMHTVVGSFSSLLTSACLTYLVAIAYTFISKIRLKLSHFSCEIFNKSHAIFVLFFLLSFFKLNFLQRKCCRCRDYNRNLFSFSTPFSLKFIFKFVNKKE